ncbi:hypothetical protein V5799_005523 [Amblyomma americanum]|uniref:Uncharacterized protein n=1 Tax=Amblyomma americanum TaxID=6943 RepID=A0AAQ4DZ06_AMBAM
MLYARISPQCLVSFGSGSAASTLTGNRVCCSCVPSAFNSNARWRSGGFASTPTTCAARVATLTVLPPGFAESCFITTFSTRLGEFKGDMG